jgi:hypothetical protein
MKNTKIFVILSGIAALLCGAVIKDSFHTKLSKSISVDSVKFCADTETPRPPEKVFKA